MKGALGIFRELTSVPTAPYREKAVGKVALRWIERNLGKRVSVEKRRGGLIVRYHGGEKGSPFLALAAHLDHPAFQLTQVSKLGALGKLEGGLPPHLLEGEAVEAWPEDPKDNRPLALGVLSAGSKDGLYPIRWTTPPAPGKKPVFATLALTPFAIEGKWLLSRSVDDLLGCAVSLEAMRRCVKAKVPVNLAVLLHRAEEVGFVGALDLIAEGSVPLEDTVLSIESSRELPGARPGKGPVIRLGDKACVFDLNATALLDQAAAVLKKKKVRVQRLRLTGGTCEATAYQAFGYEAGGVAVPLVNYHNGWGADAIAPEMVRVEDVEGATRLLEQAARLWPKASPRGALRKRLALRHHGAAKRLA